MAQSPDSNPGPLRVQVPPVAQMEHQWKVLNNFEYLQTQRLLCTQCGIEVMLSPKRNEMWRMEDIGDTTLRGDGLRQRPAPRTCEEEFVRQVMEE